MLFWQIDCYSLDIPFYQPRLSQSYFSRLQYDNAQSMSDKVAMQISFYDTVKTYLNERSK
ncbi:hypothetical protein GCM10009410_03020 [Shewanella ulleungensis]|uniref:Uncharacterized protein n=1 Tax=Shewanella ulleungensis TaxID=2282699 RepID=A0ABQ2QCA2_9GAMM|nr:hypothetical protein GCM10009410_03020 [Shewanella ulleungensis]